MSKIESLSFIGTRKKGEPGDFPRHFWRVSPTGDYQADCETGRALALEYLAYEEASPESCGILPMIVGDMPRDLTGIEISFLMMVRYAARAGAPEARRVDAYWRRCEVEEVCNG